MALQLNLLRIKRFDLMLLKGPLDDDAFFIFYSLSVSMADPNFNPDQFAEPWAEQLFRSMSRHEIGSCLSHPFASFATNTIIIMNAIISRYVFV